MTQVQLDAVLSGINQAAELWGRYINAPSATIDVALSFTDLSGSTLAQAGPNFFSFGGPFLSEVNEELNGNAGGDLPSYGIIDGDLTIDLPRILNGSFHYSETTAFEANPGAQGQTDFLSLITHELGHILGFNGIEFDDFTTGGAFTGANAVAANGGPVPLSGTAHLTGSDLMSPSLTNNVREVITPVHIAILKDLGVPIAEPTSGDDVLFGFHLLDDTILAGAGNDTLIGLTGNDTLDGGPGSDTVSYEFESSGVTVRLELDSATGSSSGTDVLTSIENVTGSNFADIIFGDNSVNVINGLGGDDRIFALGDNDTVNGGDGNDTLNGNDGNDIFFGGAGDDTLLGAQGMDQLTGDSGNDVLSGGSGDDILNGDEGDDTVLGGGDNDTLNGGVGNDTLSGGGGDDDLDGGDNDDTVLGASGNDTVLGGDGVDIVSGGAGIDVVDGGAGNDQVFGADGNDTSVSGGAGNDTVSGGVGNDNVFGNSGDDNILGASGDDRLDGGTGIDTLTGGIGFDTLVFAVNYDADTVQGFEDDIDTLEFDDALWTGTHGALTEAQVVSIFATQTSPGIVDFNFGNGDTLRVVNGAGIAANDLIDDISIV